MEPSATPANPTSAHPAPAAATPGEKLPGAFSLFGPSWEALKLNLIPFVLGVAIPIVLLFIPLFIAFASISTSTPSQTPGSYTSSGTAALNISAILVGVLGVVAILIFFIPYTYLLKLQSARGVKTTFKATLKQSMHFLWRLLGLTICRSLVILGGIILLIVPGLFMWRRYMLAPFYLIDEDCGVFEAMKKSAADSVPFSSAIWGMIGVYILMDVLGIIPIVGGIVGGILGIVYVCASAIRYVQIKQAKAKA